jgi:plasmid maintenance system antidote protein VapI
MPLTINILARIAMSLGRKAAHTHKGVTSMNRLKKELLAQMKEQGITQTELARRLKVCRQAVYGFFNKKQTTDIATIHRYAKAIGCKLIFKVVKVG